MAKVRHRRFKEATLQALYDELRGVRLDPKKVNGKGGTGNAYAVGYTRPEHPNRAFPMGSRSYAAWAAGVDNARTDQAQTVKVETPVETENSEPTKQGVRRP